MVTRALAAEIRHAPESFITFLQEHTGLDGLGELESVRCEGRANVDVELTSRNRAGYSLGIEAKFDHELTPQQISSELEVHGHLVLVLPSIDAVPRWLAEEDRVIVMTWSEMLDCFTDCRITDEDIDSIPLSKLAVEILLNKLELQDRFPTDWYVRAKRTDGGLPAILVKSPWLPNGRIMVGQLQVSGKSMLATKDDVRLNYSFGVAVDDDDEDFPIRHSLMMSRAGSARSGGCMRVCSTGIWRSYPLAASQGGIPDRSAASGSFHWPICTLGTIGGW